MKRDTATPKVRNKLPGPYAEKWIRFHMRNAAQATYQKNFVWDRAAPAIGPFCTDPDGNIFLDFASHVASNPLGYNHPALTDIAGKLAKIDPDRYAGTDFIGAYGRDPQTATLPTPSHLHQKLLQITSHFGFDKAFLSNSGSEAVENAVKLCYQYRKNFGYGFTFEGAFHGRTLGSLSLNRSKNLHRSWYPQIPYILSFPYDFCHGESCGFGGGGGGISGGGSDAIEHMLDPEKGLISPEEVAFIIIEPVQGEGGYNFPHIEFIKGVAKTARKHGIPLICDEIQSGMGRTGKWWACEHFGIKPEIITAGKALRVGATIGHAKFFPKEKYRIGSTWGEGNAIASAVGFRTIEIIEKENLMQNAADMGGYLIAELKKLEAKYPALVSDVRGLGLLDAIEFQTRAERDRFVEKCARKGLILLGCGYKVVRILPPLNVTRRELDLCLEIIASVLAVM